MLEHVDTFKQMMSAAGVVLAAVFGVWKWYCARLDATALANKLETSAKDAANKAEVKEERLRVEKINDELVDFLQTQITELKREIEALKAQNCFIIGCRMKVSKI